MKSKFMNQSLYPRTNNLPYHMSTDASKKRRAATILAQGREKQTRNTEPEDTDIDPILNQSVKRTHKLETICTQQQAIDPTNQRIWLGWIQIEDSLKSKAHETIAKIKLEIEHVQYSEIYEGTNYLVLAIPQHEINILTTRTFPPSPNYKLVYIPTQEKIWATKTNIAATSTQSQITEGLRRIKKEKTPIGWSMIPTKRDSSMLVVYHASRSAWTNTEKSLIIEIGNTAHQLNPDVSNIPLPHIHLYTKNKNTSYSRNEWTNWITTNLGLPQEFVQSSTGLMNAFRSTSHFNAAIVILPADNIPDILTNRNEWSTIGINFPDKTHTFQVLLITQYSLSNQKPDGPTSRTNTPIPCLKTYPHSPKELQDLKLQSEHSKQEQILQTRYLRFYWQRTILKQLTKILPWEWKRKPTKELSSLKIIRLTLKQCKLLIKDYLNAYKRLISHRPTKNSPILEFKDLINQRNTSDFLHTILYPYLTTNPEYTILNTSATTFPTNRPLNQYEQNYELRLLGILTLTTIFLSVYPPNWDLTTPLGSSHDLPLNAHQIRA